MPPRSETEMWRQKAEEALAKFSRAMDFFLFATAQLVRLTEIHFPDDYNHCNACKVPHPCATLEVVKSIGSAWEVTQKEVK